MSNIKNGDMPAMPLSGDAYTNFAAADGTANTSYDPQCQGLTKREQFAAMAMQGIQSCSGQDMDYDQAAYQAVRCADALLEELEK